MGKIIFVCAGNLEQFKNFEFANRGTGFKYVYAERPEKILGYRALGVEVIGTFWEKQDADKIFELVQSRIVSKPIPTES